jgi:hypothetical protein
MSAGGQQPTPRPESEGFAATMSRAALRRLLVAAAATGATAATAYATRKAQELWVEKAAPKIEEKGGFDAVAREVFTKASEVLESASSKVTDSAPVSAVTEKVEDLVERTPETVQPDIQPVENVSDPEREAERRERRRRREARQRALQSQGTK